MKYKYSAFSNISTNHSCALLRPNLLYTLLCACVGLCRCKLVLFIACCVYEGMGVEELCAVLCPVGDYHGLLYSDATLITTVIKDLSVVKSNFYTIHTARLRCGK